jgi:transmembrane sensor
MGDVIQFSGAPTPDDEAQCWIVRIDRDKLSPEERQALHAWLAADPQHKQLLDHYAKLWHAAGKARAIPTAAAHTVVAPYPRRHGARALAAGLCAAVIGATALWLAPSRQDDVALATLSTPVGQHQAFALQDGSRVQLNTRSSAKVDYQPDQRKIELVDGEGFFEVAKNPRRPFQVYAGSTMVRAVGTKFTVYKRADGTVDVTVHEGVVDITRYAGAATTARAAPLALQRAVAGQAVQSKADGFAVSTLPALKLHQLLAWQQDRVSFDQTPLAAALDEMSRYSTLPIVLGTARGDPRADQRLRAIKVSGSFSTRNLAAFLTTLEQGFALKVSKTPGAIVLTAAAS